MDEATPIHLCECGCGQPTTPAKTTWRAGGYVKGQPLRFIHGHNLRVIPLPIKRPKPKTGADNPGWKGDQAGYSAFHRYLQRHYPKTGACEECATAATRTDYALIHGRTYSHNREDYRELCRPCHAAYDHRGRKVTPEQRARMSAGRKRRWEEDRRREESAS